jgi:excisionase family DNA binding protein
VKTHEPEQARKGLGKVSQVSDYLNVSRAKTYSMMDAGDLPYVKLGKSRRIPWDAVERLVNDNLVNSQG